MIAIIDYGVGNLFSLQSSLKFIGAEAKVTNDVEEIRAAWKRSFWKKRQRGNPCWAFASGCRCYWKRIMNTANMKVWG